MYIHSFQMLPSVGGFSSTKGAHNLISDILW